MRADRSVSLLLKREELAINRDRQGRRLFSPMSDCRTWQRTLWTFRETEAANPVRRHRRADGGHRVRSAGLPGSVENAQLGALALVARTCGQTRTLVRLRGAKTAAELLAAIV